MQRTTSYLTPKELRKLVRGVQEDGKHRFALYIALSASIGLRVTDMLSMKWSDIATRSGVKEMLKVKERKTGKVREIYPAEFIRGLIEDSLDILEPESMEEYIFASKRREGAWTTQGINYLLRTSVKKHCENVKGNVSSHMLRKTFGRNYFDQCEDKAMGLIHLQEILNHFNMNTTKRYLGITSDELREAYTSVGETLWRE